MGTREGRIRMLRHMPGYVVQAIRILWRGKKKFSSKIQTWASSFSGVLLHDWRVTVHCRQLLDSTWSLFLSGQPPVHHVGWGLLGSIKWFGPCWCTVEVKLIRRLAESHFIHKDVIGGASYGEELLTFCILSLHFREWYIKIAVCDVQSYIRRPFAVCKLLSPGGSTTTHVTYGYYMQGMIFTCIIRWFGQVNALGSLI